MYRYSIYKLINYCPGNNTQGLPKLMLTVNPEVNCEPYCIVGAGGLMLRSNHLVFTVSEYRFVTPA